MPNLFPTMTAPDLVDSALEQASQVKFGSSYSFDFKKGDFNVSPSGRVVGTEGVAAWIRWCEKALMTARYRYLVYSRSYGQEFDDLIGSGLTRGAMESEIRRIATECLMADPRTAKVDNFGFQWQGDTVVFTCDLTNIRSESGTATGSVVIGG